jgi:hypothetical protein
MLATDHACAQATEDTRRANDTISARDAEINTLRTTIELVIRLAGSFKLCYRLLYAYADN